ncbi:hypothetical protein [Escherichia coli]|uniref:hypothetical protein n=1 Tax=Escherichia coli TaxID=562 RepID=UPI0015D4E04C|nr:hypothetical protein [Escherichia coli]NYZ31087.1 hypothetical protein [Escherichia coli]
MISNIAELNAVYPLARGTHERGTPGVSSSGLSPLARELGTCLIICVATVGLSAGAGTHDV